MKIIQDVRLNTDKVRSDTRQQAGTGVKFNELVQKQDEKMYLNQLDNLLTDIESAGDRLARSRTFKDLVKFKTLVKKFVKETVDFGLGLKQSHSWNQFGQGRSLKIVDTVDEKLVELTETIMNREEKSIDILGKVGEIKGLLINLYT